MKIAFFSIAHEALAISILSAIAKKEGHTLKLIHTSNLFNDGYIKDSKWLSKLFNEDKRILEEIKHYQPDIIAFSVVTFQYQISLRYAEIFKKICSNAKIIFGGIHPSSVPEIVIANECVDYIVIGEGDIAFPEIIRRIEKGNFIEPIVNTWYKSFDNSLIKGEQTGFIQDLDSLPQYDKEIWTKIFPLKTYYATMTSRGCPFNCSYCFNHFFKCLPDEKSNYIRRRSIPHIMEELVTNKKKYNIKRIEFWDDILTFDKKWLKEFLEAYKKEITLPFKCYIHVNSFDEDIAMWLSDAGCKWADFGIQNINEEYRKKYLKRNETNANIIKAIQLLKKYKIISFADYIVGLPGDSEDHYEEARLFFIANMPDIIEPYWMSYHPKTKILEKAIERKILTSENIELINHGLSPHNYFKSSFATKNYLFYNNFYFIFKVLPALPVFLRNKFTFNFVRKIPKFIKRLIEIYATIYLGLKHKNPRYTYIIAVYRKQLFRIILSKFFSKKDIYGL